MFKLNRLLLTPSNSPVFFIVLVDILAAIAAVITALLAGYAPTHFMEEGEPLTYFSSLQLVSIALVCGRVFSIRVEEGFYFFWKSRAFIWLLLSLGFVFLAADELLQFHETFDRFIHNALNLQQSNLTDRLDDLIILLYGLFFCIATWFSQKELKPYQQVSTLLKVGMALFGMMVLFDAISNKSDIFTNKEVNEWIGALEDALKIVAEGVFFSVAYECLQIAKKLPFNHFNATATPLAPKRVYSQEWFK